MIAMNARAELQGVAFDVIARDFLVARHAATAVPRECSGRPSSGAIAPAAARPAARRGFRDKLFGADLARLTREHLMLVVVSVALAALIGIPLAIAVAARRPGATADRHDRRAADHPLARHAGAADQRARRHRHRAGADRAHALRAAADRAQHLHRSGRGAGRPADGGARARPVAARPAAAVELPLAFPTLIAGVSTATVICVGTATIAAFIGAGGYGERIVTGLALNDNALMVAGALPAALLALLCEGAFELFERRRRRG